MLMVKPISYVLEKIRFICITIEDFKKYSKELEQKNVHG